MKYSIILLFFLFSCMSTKKAKKSIKKINREYPELLANYCRDSLPCITSNVDTFTSYDTNYIKIDCNVYDYDSAFIDTVWLTSSKTQLIDKPVYIASVGKVNTIIKTIKDSAEIRSCELELLTLNKKNNQLVIDNNKLEKKISRRTFWLLYLIIAFLFSVILNIIKFK